MIELTWEQKLFALNALGVEHHLVMRWPGDWFVLANVSIGGDGVSLKSICGNGIGPQSAVEDHWDQAAKELPETEYLVIMRENANTIWRRWNGFMWEDATQLRNRHVAKMNPGAGAHPRP